MKDSKTERSFERAKNLVRGALALQKKSNTPDLELKKWQQGGAAKQQIDRALEIAKSDLPEERFKAFEQWTRKTIASQTATAQIVGTTVTNLGLFPKEISTGTLASELRLASERLKPVMSELVAAAHDLARIGRYILHQDFAAASLLLEVFDLKFGRSYTSIELDLYLACSTHGVDVMKQRIKYLTTSTSGYHKFLLHHFGQRNEPAQAAARFKVLMRKRIDEAELPASLRIYTKYRTYGHVSAVGTDLAAILASEAYTCLLDQAIALSKVVRTILTSAAGFSLDELKKGREVFEQIAEFDRALLTIQTSPSDEGEDGDQQIKSVCIQALLNSIGESQVESHGVLVQLAINGIASQLSTRSDGLAAERLAKEILNLSWVGLLSRIGDLSLIGPLPKMIVDLSEGRPTAAPHGAIMSLRAVLMTCLAELAESDPKERPREAALQALTQLSATGSTGGGDRTAIQSIIDTSHELKDLFMVLSAHVELRADQFDKCLATCAEAGILNDRLIPFLPLQDMFQGTKFATLMPYAKSVDLPISLDHYLKIDDDRKHRTNKRYAVEELLKYLEVESFGQVPERLHRAGVVRSKIQHFCLSACDKGTLELLPNLGNSKAVKIVQADVLRGLARLHSGQELQYINEANAIDEQLQVDEGVTVLDESLVYVDEKAVLNFVNQEYAADFQRYLSLVASGKGVAESLPELMKSLQAPSAKTFQIPKNDADDLFGQLLSSILERFIRDPAGGLDTIIGRRVRHGTISSELRGALEAVDLIGQKPRAGAQYDSSSRVVQISNKYEPRKKRIINAAFARFSESIDALITFLRDERFQIASHEKQRGAFDLQLNALVLSYARVIAQTCTSIEEFSAECLDVFWLFLATRTEAIRPAVELEARKALQLAFDKLMNELTGLNVQEPQLMESLQKSFEELQRRATLIASWIRVPTKTGLEGKTFPMQRILDVVLAVVTGRHPTFRPKVNSTTSDVSLDAHGFSIVSDALQIALSNVEEHSGLRAGWLKITVTGPNEKQLLSFSVRNQVAPGIKTSERETRIATMLSDINRRAHSERARRDKGSGLSKLAVLVLQSNNTSIQFGFESQDVFYVQFELLFIGLKNGVDIETECE